MKKVRNFLVAMVAATILAAALTYLDFEVNFLIFGFMPLVLLAFISESKGNKETWSGILSVALVYSVMYSPWTITSVAVVIIMIAYSFFRTPQENLSLMAAWLVSLEISAAALEYYTDNTYYMHNLWHDIATLAFVFYSLYWDIRLAKKEVTQ